ncbi:ATP-binding cassette domain-containing protein [Paracoccus sp. (in: a-proteobacteria)]|uniref:ATP-binding cassette domain-containing protein n=1 Tax=Paracoccus sp. TaxID=267 RepID=UPI00396C85BB
MGKSSILRLFAGLGEGVGAERSVSAVARHHIQCYPKGAPARGDPAAEAGTRCAETVGMAAHADKRPDMLSGGQRQRVALARTLMEDRPVVLLDEPFSALDSRMRALMQDLTAELLGGRTVLHVTYDAAEAARVAHRVLLMTRDGIQRISPPDSAPPRFFDAPETLTFQGRLLRLLMETR